MGKRKRKRLRQFKISKCGTCSWWLLQEAYGYDIHFGSWQECIDEMNLRLGVRSVY